MLRPRKGNKPQRQQAHRSQTSRICTLFLGWSGGNEPEPQVRQHQCGPCGPGTGLPREHRQTVQTQVQARSPLSVEGGRKKKQRASTTSAQASASNISFSGGRRLHSRLGLTALQRLSGTCKPPVVSTTRPVQPKIMTEKNLHRRSTTAPTNRASRPKPRPCTKYQKENKQALETTTPRHRHRSPARVGLRQRAVGVLLPSVAGLFANER